MDSGDQKLECSLKENCYRKKREHFELHSHSRLTKLLEEFGSDINSWVIPRHKYKVSFQTLKQQLKFLQNINDNTDDNKVEEQEEDINKSLMSSLGSFSPSKLNSLPTEMNTEASSTPICSFGEKCYRRNPKHFEEFSHPHLEKLLKLSGQDKDINIPKEYSAQISKETLKLQLNFIKKQVPEKEENSDRNSPKPSNSQSVEERNCKKVEGKQAQAVTRRNEASSQQYRIVVLDRVKYPILDKLMSAAPYNFFLTTISNSTATHNEMLSVTMAELLDPNLGQLQSSLQINFMVQFGWLLAQYHIMGHRNTPLTLLYGDIDTELDGFKHFLTAVKVKPPSTFGSHHSKMMVFSYTDGSIRIVVSTANLVESDWDNRSQGLWISPRCRPLQKESDTMAGDSPTNFKKDIIKYLSAYKLPELVTWIKKIQNVNMSAIKVFFISSVPGTHYSPSGKLKHDWGHPSLAKLLNEHITIPDRNSYPVIIQCSSIGSLGPRPESWLLSDILTTFTSGKRDGVYSKPALKFIYPSFENIASSYDGLLGGGCLPYSRNTHMKQEWLTSFMSQWISDKRHRTRAPPHIKSYCRVSPDFTKLSYFVLTSANMSKAAWGMLTKSGSLNILSYEAGVLFLPQFLLGKDYFPLTDDSTENDSPVFPMPYDLPTTPYAYSDTPWFIENIL